MRALKMLEKEKEENISEGLSLWSFSLEALHFVFFEKAAKGGL